MLTKQELDGLRKDGVSDDEILSGYRDFDKTHNGDIDGLLKDGVKSKDILDGLTEFKGAPKAEAKAETWGDTATNFRKGAQYGLAGVASGVGKTLEASGYTNAGPYLENVGKKIAPADYTPASSKFRFSDLSSYGYIPRALVEGAPGAAVDIGGGLIGGAVGGPAGFVAGSTAAHTARSYGDNLEDRLAYQGKTLADATGSDQAIALGSSAAEGAIGALGVKGAGGALSSVTKGAGAQAVAQLPGQIAIAGARDGLSGVAGNLVQQTGRTVATEPGLSISPEEAANAGALSAGGGGALRGVRGVGDVYQSGRMRGLMDDPESSTRVADAIKRTELDVRDPKNASDAMRLVEGQLQRATKADDVKAFLKESDGETRGAVNDALDRVRRGHPLTEGQLNDLQTRLGSNPAGQNLMSAVTDLHTLQRVKGLGTEANGKFENPGAAGSLLGRVTNPFNRLTVGAGAAGAGAAYAIPAVAQSAALANVLGAAPAVIGGAALVQGGLRGADALLGTRRPLDQFTQRFAGFEPGAAPQAPQGMPAFAPRPEENPARVDAQTDRAWAKYRALQAQEEANRARQAAQEDRAWSSREEDPQARAAQEEAMWRDRESDRARSQNEDDQAQDGIAEGYRLLLARAEAAQNLRAQQEAQARAEAARQNSEEDRVSATRAREFERARGQVPDLTERAKSAQIAAAFKAQAAQEAAQAGPRGWSDADALEAIRGAQRASQADSDAILRRNSIERAAANPVPVEETVTAQPKAQVKPKAEKPKGDKAKAEKKAKDEGDSFELDGITHPIPDNVYNRAGYIKSIKRKQGQIDTYLRRAQDDGFISEKTDNALSDLREELKTARSKKQARQTVDRITRQSSETDRSHIMRTFDDDFFGIWAKDE